MKSEEIARLAGVSRSTVSRVINNYSNVPPETREKVMKVIRDYAYEPNTSARVLAGKGTDTLGLFLFSMHHRKNTNRVFGNNYFSPLVDAVVDAGNARGYYVLVHTLYEPADCWRIRQTMAQKRIDGALLIGTESLDEVEKILSEPSLPLAVMDYDPLEIKRLAPSDARITLVNGEDQKGMEACVDYLAGLGHREIGFLDGRHTTFSGRVRSRAFKERLEFHGITPNPAFIANGDFIGYKTEEAMERLLMEKQLPTALIAANDEMALAAMNSLKKKGLKVPGNVAVIGFDDAMASAIVRPSLTTVSVPYYAMAHQAVASLIDTLESGRTGLKEFCFPVELIIRESSGNKLSQP